MVLSYMSGDNRNLTVSVNGKDVQTLSCNSGSYEKVATKTLKVTLQQGENTIRLYNKSSADMPSIDCMTIQPVDATERVVVGIQAPAILSPAQLTDGKYYTIDGKLVRHPRKGGLYIYKGKKVLF